MNEYTAYYLRKTALSLMRKADLCPKRLVTRKKMLKTAINQDVLSMILFDQK
jgi:hypothetical protein